MSSPPRLIEVKAFGKSNRGYDLWLETRQVEEARRNPDFYVYVVENVAQGDPATFTLKVLGGQRLARLLERAKEQRYYTVPWPVAEYDSAPTALEDGAPGPQPPAPPAPARVQPPPSGTSATNDEVIVFRDDDAVYLRWLAEHPAGYVVNAERKPKPSYLKLHRATCTWISGRGKAGACTERDYIKACSTDLAALERWAKQTAGGSLDSGCACT